MKYRFLGMEVQADTAKEALEVIRRLRLAQEPVVEAKPERRPQVEVTVAPERGQVVPRDVHRTNKPDWWLAKHKRIHG